MLGGLWPTDAELMFEKPIPIAVVDGTVLVATIGATVAAATGVTVLKMGFCLEQKKERKKDLLF